jgi:hypothetical protein
VATEFEDLRGATGAVGQAIADIGATVRHAAGKINSVLLDVDLDDTEKRLLGEAVADLEKLAAGINQMALDPEVDIPASDNGIGTPPERNPLRPDQQNLLPPHERNLQDPARGGGYGRPREVPEAIPVAQEEVVVDEQPEGYLAPPPPPSYGSY